MIFPISREIQHKIHFSIYFLRSIIDFMGLTSILLFWFNVTNSRQKNYSSLILLFLSLSPIKGVIIFGSDQEVAGMMRAVGRNNATGIFSWIGSDGWSARSSVNNGNEPQVEGTLSVSPRSNPVQGKQFLCTKSSNKYVRMS